MKILFTTSNDHVSFGGSEELWVQTAKYFLENGHEVAVCVSWYPLPKQLDYLQRDKKFTLIKKEIKPSVFNKLVPTKFKRYYEPYKNRIIKWSPNIALISQGCNEDGIGLMSYFQKNNIPYFSISQCVLEYIWPDIKKAKLMEDAFKKAVFNFFVSQANKETTELMIAEKIENSSVVRNPFNVPYDTTLNFPKSQKTYSIACVGRYHFVTKGQDVLIKVLCQQKWKERNLIVNFYGSGIHKQNLEKLINLFTLKNAIVNEFTPTVNIWETNQALILPSRFEGLPLVLVEAMLCGRFGIVTNVSGNSEAFIDNETGFLAEGANAIYVDDALERAWSRRDEWEEIGNKAKQYIKSIVPEFPEKELYNSILMHSKKAGLI